MLPHIGIGEFCETKKAYYFGSIFCGLMINWKSLVDNTSHIHLLLLPDISSIVFYHVLLDEDHKMIGIIMETKGWILPGLYWEVFLERLV